MTPVRRALVSVYDKQGLADLAGALHEAGATIISTGSTAAFIDSAGVPVTAVSELTGFPEIMHGRVKTLHPAIHAAILADRDRPEHRSALTEHGFEPIDLVVANLYPFAEAASHPARDPAAVMEMIDVGGPTMVRAAAKNHAHVGVVVDPDDYPDIIVALREDGGLSPALRGRLARKAFAHTAAYDAAIASWLTGGDRFPERLTRSWRKAQDLRYGENPHQAAAYYVADNGSGLATAQQLSGKELSYNNLVDADAAWAMAADFTEPCVVIVKHTNPAGLATGPDLAAAYPKALAGDPVSAFGGIVAVNARLDAATARQIVKVFTEVVVAPEIDPDALEILQTKKNLRVLAVPDAAASDLSLRGIAGGILIQDTDLQPETPDEWTVPTAVAPDEETLDELGFAWQACKHVKSNAIVLVHDRALVGVGAGQMSRVDSVRVAIRKAGGRERGAVLASDALFPFRDGPDAAMDAGVRAVIQPGGSVRDREVVAACDERGVAMVFTGRRHFRH